MDLKRADAIGQNPALHEQKLGYIDELEKIFRQETANGETYTVKSLKIDGNDLKKLGITNGREIGKCLKMLLSMVIDGEIKNQTDELISAVRNKYN